MTRGVLKWAGVGCSVALAALAVASIWLDVAFDEPYWAVSARQSALRVDWQTGELVDAFGPRGWNVAPHAPRVTLLPTARRMPIGSSMTMYRIIVPLWIPTLLIASSTAWLWRRGGPRPAHACGNCGYDLRGVNTGGVCPECGAPATRA